MTAAAPSQIVELHDTVKSLLGLKSAELWSISPEASVFDAIEIMSEKHIGALVVLNAGQLAGIITERDYARKVILMGRQSRETRVRDIMTAPVLFVTPDQTVAECMHLMTSQRIRHLPVQEAGHVVAMLSIGDLVNWIITAQEQTIRHLHNYIVGSYPG